MSKASNSPSEGPIFGQAIRHFRGKLKISQEDLADKAQLHRTYISDIERGSRNVSLKNIFKLAKALGVPSSKLFLFVERGMKRK